MNQWYYRNGAAQVGPVDDERMKALVAAGTVAASTPVWTAGMAAWTTAGAAGLCGAVPPPVPGAAAAQMRQANEALKTIGIGAWASLKVGGGAGTVRVCALVMRILAVLCLLLGLFQLGIFGMAGGAATLSFDSLLSSGRPNNGVLAWFASFLSGALTGFFLWCQSLLLDAARIVLSKQS